MAVEVKRYKLVFFVPESHKETVKRAVFEQGAGQYQAYDQCAWEVKGQGQFKPRAGAKPFIGETNKLERVTEYRVEMICSGESIKAVLKALILSHPYETPAYEVWPVSSLEDF